MNAPIEEGAEATVQKIMQCGAGESGKSISVPVAGWKPCFGRLLILHNRTALPCHSDFKFSTVIRSWGGQFVGRASHWNNREGLKLGSKIFLSG